jgi:hypothetical protein
VILPYPGTVPETMPPHRPFKPVAAPYLALESERKDD